MKEREKRKKKKREREREREMLTLPFYLFIYFIFLYWGLISGPTPLTTPPALFCDEFFFKIKSHELFALADFKL
jgi:hypothetical protein